MRGLTALQKTVLSTIHELTMRHGTTPAIDQIAVAANTNVQQATGAVRTLVVNNYIRRSGANGGNSADGGFEILKMPEDEVFPMPIEYRKLIEENRTLRYKVEALQKCISRIRQRNTDWEPA